MRIVQILVSAAFGAVLVAVALSQQQSNSNSQSHTGNNSASASSSSSANSNGFGSQSAQGSQSGHGSGSGTSIRIPKPTHVILFTRTPNWSEQANDQIKTERVMYFAKLQQAAKLVYFGPWRDVPGEMSILVTTDQEASSIANADPAVKAGLETAEVRAWTVQVEPYTSVAGVR